MSRQEAPHERLIDVLRDNLNRSRKRIESAGLFDSAPVDAMQILVAAERDALLAKPFLHDMTTKNVIATADSLVLSTSTIFASAIHAMLLR